MVHVRGSPDADTYNKEDDISVLPRIVKKVLNYDQRIPVEQKRIEAVVDGFIFRGTPIIEVRTWRGCIWTA